MRVLHFLPWHSPRTRGGTESFLLQLAKLQQMRGDDVRIIAPNEGPEVGCEIIDGICVSYFPRAPECEQATFQKIVEEIAPDVIHLHGLDYVFKDFFQFVIDQRKPRLVMTLHLVNVVSPDRTRTRAVTALIERISPLLDGILRATGLQSIVARFVTYPTSAVNQARLMAFLRESVMLDVLSPWFMKELLRNDFSPARIRLRPNPMHATDAVKALPEEPVSGRPMRFLFVGRMSADKGVTTIIDALTSLTDLRDRFEVTFVGRQVEEGIIDRLKKLADQGLTIAFAGEIPQEEVASHIERADYVVFPSIKAEMAPLVIQEALSRGRPVIASKHPSSVAYIKDGISGYFFDRESHADLAALMRRIIGSRSRITFSLTVPPDFEDVLYRHYRDLYAL